MRLVVAGLAVVGVIDLLVFNLVAVPRFLEERQTEETVETGALASASVESPTTVTPSTEESPPSQPRESTVEETSHEEAVAQASTEEEAPAEETQETQVEETQEDTDSAEAETEESTAEEQEQPTPDLSDYRPRPLLFASAAASLGPRARQQLDELIEYLRQSNKTITVRGHADNRGEEDRNLGLSRRRAESVSQYLVEHGIGRDRMELEWRGEREPADPSDTPTAWARNRRVEILIR